MVTKVEMVLRRHGKYVRHGAQRADFSLMDAAFEVASNSHGAMAVALNLNIITYLASPAAGAINSPG